MNIQEACNLLGIELGASKEDAKKAFRKKASEYHPDKNSSEGAEQKFKEINSAYQLVEKHGTTPQHSNVSSEFYEHGEHLAEELRRRMNVNVNFGFGFGRPVQFRSEPIIVSAEIPFDVAVLGGKKEIVYERSVKCEACTGGKISTNKVMCPKCGGHGHRKYGSDDRELPCTTCGATGYTTNGVTCTECQGSGIRKSIDTLKVSIPPGMESGIRLILKGKGNYNTTIGHYDNVIAIISVLSDHDMQLSNGDVISVIELSLLEALQGTKKIVRTVKGEKTLAFKPKTRHRDTIRVAGFGVPPHGAHTVVVNVSYPDNVDDIIDVLNNKDKPDLEEISGIQS
jgi:molecular chaperone DnaJ